MGLKTNQERTKGRTTKKNKDVVKHTGTNIASINRERNKDLGAYSDYYEKTGPVSVVPSVKAVKGRTASCPKCKTTGKHNALPNIDHLTTFQKSSLNIKDKQVIKQGTILECSFCYIPFTARGNCK